MINSSRLQSSTRDRGSFRGTQVQSSSHLDAAPPPPGRHGGPGSAASLRLLTRGTAPAGVHVGCVRRRLTLASGSRRTRHAIRHLETSLAMGFTPGASRNTPLLRGSHGERQASCDAHVGVTSDVSRDTSLKTGFMPRASRVTPLTQGGRWTRPATEASLGQSRVRRSLRAHAGCVT